VKRITVDRVPLATYLQRFLLTVFRSGFPSICRAWVMFRLTIIVTFH